MLHTLCAVHVLLSLSALHVLHTLCALHVRQSLSAMHLLHTFVRSARTGRAECSARAKEFCALHVLHALSFVHVLHYLYIRVRFFIFVQFFAKQSCKLTEFDVQ